MSFILGNGGVLNSFVLAPGATIWHSYWWDNLPLGNDAWVATMLHPSIATVGATAYVVGNGMNPSPRVTYFAEVRADGGGQSAVYRLRVGQLA
jgi:hypothetical protein